MSLESAYREDHRMGLYLPYANAIRCDRRLNAFPTLSLGSETAEPTIWLGQLPFFAILKPAYRCRKDGSYL